MVNTIHGYFDKIKQINKMLANIFIKHDFINMLPLVEGTMYISLPK